jgi:quinol monooxygenase YgiN
LEHQVRDLAFRYSDRMLIVTGSIEARPDTIDRILELGVAHVRRSRQEPGCLLHSIHRDVENDLRVVFIEHWEDAAALEAHFRVHESGEFVREAAALALRPPEISIFDAEVAAMPNPAPLKRGV